MRRIAIFVLALGLGGMGNSWGTICRWIGNNGPGGANNWTNTGNWTCGRAPNTTTDTALFNDSSASSPGVNTDPNTFGYIAQSNFIYTVALAAKRLTIYGIAADFRGGTFSVTTGRIIFVGTSAATFYPSAGTNMGVIVDSATGGVTVSTNYLKCDTLRLSNLASNGAFNLGSGLNDTVSGSLTFAGGGSNGSLNFSSSTLWYGGATANFTGLTTLTQGTGTLNLYASSGTVVLTPKSGATHPGITHSGASTLQLATNALTCLSFSQTAGILDFNSLNITTTSSGNFSITNGTTTAISNLGGRTLTVAGTTTLNGQSGNLLDLNPGSAWTIASTGALTANYATVQNSNASVSAGTATNSTDGGSNTNWNFGAQITWNGGGTDGTCGGGAGDGNKFSCTANWDLGRVPGSSDTARFNGTSTKNCKLTAAASVKAITFTSAYTGTFDFQSYTLTVGSGSADFSSGGTITAGTGTIAFTGASGTQVFKPKSGTTHPNITHGGAGTLQLSTYALTCLSFSQTAGILDFNSLNLTTTSSGNFSITNGTTTSISNLGGRTLTVAGTTTLNGQSGNLLDLNPGSAWTIASTGALSADYATLMNSTASVSAGTATNSTDGGSNVNWTVQATPVYWNRNAVLTSSTDFNAAFNWTVNADGTGAHPTSTTDDAFTADALGASWTFQDADNDGGTGANSLTSNADQLTLTGRGLDIWNATNQYVAVYRSDITGDFDVSVKLVSQGPNGKAGIMMADDFTTLGSGGFATVNWTSTYNRLQFEVDVSGTVGQIETSDPIDFSTTPVWLRLVKSGTSVSGYYKTSLSAAWTQIGSTRTPQSTSANSQVGLFSTAISSSTTATSVFDDFQGGTVLNDNTIGLSFNGSGANKNANATMTASVAANNIDFTNYTGTFNFGSYTLTLNTGNAKFGASQTVTAGTGTVAFTAASGTQVLTPKSGATHPSISHTGAGTLQLATNALTCLSFSQSAGVFDFNSLNLTTTSSGNFSITNGTTTSLSNLGGRTLTVAGTTSLNGQSGNLLDLNPSSAWTIASTGALTASYSDIKNSTASVSAGVATYSTNSGSNTNWTFPITGDYNNWAYSKSIVFNTTSSNGGANTSTNLANFPVLLRFTNTNFPFGKAKDNGTDIRFADPDGTHLSYQIERWDKANQLAEVWVRVPQIDGNSAADYVKMYWGNSSAGDSSSSSNTFRDADNYKAVYHFNGDVTDATSNANNGQDSGSTTTTGVIANARALSGSPNFISVPDAASLDFTPAALTLSAWIYCTNWDGTTSNRRVLQKGTTDSSQWGFRDKTGVDSLTFDLGPGGAASPLPSVSPPSINNWHLVTGTYDGTNKKIYVDGVLTRTVGATGVIPTTTGRLNIGRKPGSATAGNYFPGNLDEIRIQNVARSADWVTMEYATQKASPTCIFYGAPYSDWAYSSEVHFNTTSSGANVTSNITSFPMLVRLDSNNFLFSQAKSDGADIRFADPDGTVLPYSIENWDYTNKAAQLWVRVPQVDGNSNTDYMKMYWGRPDAQSQSNDNGVFQTGDNFTGVWHMNGNVTDATSNANNGTDNGTDTTTGLISNGRDFSSDYIDIPTSASLNALTNFTGYGWVNTNDYLGAAFQPFMSFYTSATDRTYLFYESATLGFDAHNDIDDATVSYNTNAAIANKTWVHLGWVVNGTNWYIYVNGVQAASGASVKTLADLTDGFTTNLGMRAVQGTYYWNGKMDEVRLDGTARSADWLKLSYETQKSGTTAVTYPNTDLSTFTYKTKVYVNTTATGANLTSNVTNYPMLVRLDPSNFDFSQAKSAGEDLRFTKSNGTLLSYEIERFSATSKRAEIWVLMDTVYANNNSQYFKMYWGKSAASSLSSGAAVFKPSTGFQGTYHLNESPGATAPQFTDASGQSNTGTAQGPGVAGDSVTADVGKGFVLNGSSKYVSTLTSFSNPGTFTISSWVKTSTAQGGMIVGFNNSTTGAGTNHDRFIWMVDAGTITFGINPGGVSHKVSSATAYNDGNWHLVTGRVSSNGQFLYVDGVQVAKDATGTSGENYTGYWRAGYGPCDWVTTPTSSYLNGTLDEARFVHAELSADWIKLDYETQKATSTAVTVGYRTADFAKATIFAFNTTSSGVNVSGNVANIPILVSLTSSNFDFTQVRDDAKDVLFIDKDGSRLYHEVVQWDKANSLGKLWVKVPQVDGNSSTDFITLYYGCSTCTGNPQERPDSLWKDYNAVWHMKGTEDRVYDATPNANTGTPSTVMAIKTGITTTMSPSFDGVADAITVANNNQLDGETITISAWIKTTQTGSGANWYNSPMILDRDQSGAANAGWACVLDNGGTSKIKFVARDDELLSSGTIGDGNWHKVDLVKTTTNKYIYIDGLLDNSEADAGVVSNNVAFYLGSQDGNATFFRGQMNDVTLAPSQRSADYIKLSYQNQKENSTLFSTVTTSSFTSSKVYKFNTTSTGANVSGDVYNFPLLIRITGSTLCDAVQSGAPDIRFLDGDGVTWLPYSIERWSQSADSAEVWVNVPKMDGNSSADFITMYYNDVTDGAVPDGQCSRCVFQSSNGFSGVWHLNESSGTAADSSLNGNAGTFNGNVPNAVLGNSYKGESFDGNGDYVSMTSNSTMDMSANDVVTVSAWVKRAGNAAAGTSEGIATKVQWNGVNYRQYYLYNINSSTGFIFGVSTDGTSGNEIQVGSNFQPTNGTWYHVVGLADRSNLRIYVNGVLKNTQAFTGNLYYNSNAPFKIGLSDDDGGSFRQFFNGVIDEVTLSAVVRDSNWVRLSYESQRSSPTLYNPSPADFVSSQKYVFNTTKTGANIMDSVTNVPVLVRISGGGITAAVESNAPDIRFLDGDGKTWLNYQIERWSTSPDSAEVWVLVPQVDGNSATDFITLYYNSVTNASIADGQQATTVFDSTRGFQAAWHLNNSLNDATVNANTGTNQGSTNGGGAIGNGRAFSGTAQYATFGNGNSLKNIASYITVEAWIKTSQAAGTSRSVIRHDGHYTGLQIYTGTNAQTALWNTGLKLKQFTWNGNFDDGVWHHYVSQYTRASGITVWRDGASFYSSSSDTGVLATNGTANFALGGTEGGGELYTGNLDEVRVSNVFRDSNYIKLCYQNQRPLGNKFWTTARTGPNNKAALTASPTSGGIQLSWSSAASDSSNADSIGIWVKYKAVGTTYSKTYYPDSAKSAATRVTVVPITDSTYTYPATYPNMYYFGLAVRNTSGNWSPITLASSDTATVYQNLYGGDTIYVDSAIGLTANSCASARNPITPKRYLGEAISSCESGATDTLVIRAMPGIYTDTVFDSNSKPVVLTSFDYNYRAILNGSGTKTDGSSRNFTVWLFNDLTLRNLDIKCATNNNIGVYISQNDGNQKIEGCRIYNTSASVKHDMGIEDLGTGSNNLHIANNVIYQPTSYGFYTTQDNAFNFVNNTVIGSGVAGTKGLYMNLAAYAADMTITNNIFYNWDYGIQTTSANIGTCSNNLFWLVTSSREVTGTTDGAKILKDPLFANTSLPSPHAYKLLPTSPAIDAGTRSYASGAAACAYRSYTDPWGTARPSGSAMDIGAYEGPGFSSATAGDFDTLITATTATTVTVRNSKWKVVFDQARGGGIRYFYDMTDSTTNLLTTDSLLFNVVLNSTNAARQTSNAIAPDLVRRSRTIAYVRQRLAVDANTDLDVFYTLHASGHIFVESRLVNLSSGSLAVTTVSYRAAVGTAASVFGSGGTNTGFGYLTTSSRDVGVLATLPLDTGASGAETWVQTTASSANGYVQWATTDLGDIAQNHFRTQSFLLYLGDRSITYDKTAALYTENTAPLPLKIYSGSALHERSWQDALRGHWSLDDATGSTAKDRAVYFQHDGAITGGTWISGVRGGALSLATTDVVAVSDNDSIEAAIYWSLCFWVNPDFTNMGTTAYFLSKGTSTSDGYFIRVSGQNQITFTMGAGSATVTLNNNAWNHVAFTVTSRRQIYAYVNGILVAAGTTGATAANNATGLRFGENGAGGAADKFKGYLDDIRLFRRELDPEEIQSLITQGISRYDGLYRLRADNNNRVDLVMNDSMAQTHLQPTFYIDNWYAGRTPNYVYLNGVRLKPLTDFVSDTLNKNFINGGAKLILQLNKTITASKTALFIDDDDSTGYLGAVSRMPYLTTTYDATNKKVKVRNFADTTFGAYGSNQWELTIDLLGSTDTADGDGGIYSWKSSELSPYLALSKATDLTGAGQYTLDQMRLDNTGATEYLSGTHYTSPATNTTYTILDSSATRLKIKVNAVTINGGDPDVVIERTFTIYPSGKVFISNKWTTLSGNATSVEVVLPALYGVDADATTVSYAAAGGKAGKIGGVNELDLHSLGFAMLSVKPGSGAAVMGGSTVSATDFSSSKIGLVLNNYYTTANVGAGGVYTNYMVDISRDFPDSASLDTALTSEMATSQLMTNITGSLVTNDALDFNTDGYAEGEGAYTYAASSGGIAHFRFNATVPRVKPAFKITSWTFGTLPDYVIVDNQSLVPGYHYNAYLDNANSAVLLQFNNTYSGGTHTFFVSHKNGLAVTLNDLYAVSEKGGASLGWVTESEFENLGYHLWRRSIPMPDSAVPLADSLHAPPELTYTKEELTALGFARILPKLIPGAPDGRSSSTRTYAHFDASARFGTAYEYLLEAVDFQGKSVFFGPVKAVPENNLETALFGNFPNPFNPITFIRFSLREPLPVSLIIYNAQGRVVKTLLRPGKPLKPGRYSITWDATTDHGQMAATAPYFYRFQAGQFVKTKKMILLK